MSKEPSSNVPLRIPVELELKIQEAARRTGLAKSVVMRLAMEIGFEDLRRINYDVPGSVVDRAHPALASSQANSEDAA